MGRKPPLVSITTQQDNTNASSFVAIRMIDDPWNRKDSQSLQGELHKGGIKKITILTAHGPKRPRAKSVMMGIR